MRLFLHFIVVKHLLWAWMLLMTPETQSGITAIVLPLQYLALGNPTVLALEYILISIAVEIALWFESEKLFAVNQNWYFFGFFCSIIQQLFVTIAAAGSLIAVLNGSYLDGTVASWQHILGDQDVYILIAPFHVIAISRSYILPFVKMIWN